MFHSGHSDTLVQMWQLDVIMSRRYSQARIKIHKERSNHKILTRDGYDAAVRSIIAVAPQEERTTLQQQVQFASDALVNPDGLRLNKVTLDTEASRLLWGATIMHINDHPQIYGPAEQHAVWKKALLSEWAQAEMIKSSSHLYKSVGDKDAIVRWGKPGSWFYFSPPENLVNLDLMHALIMPEYLRVFFHEEGHRMYTLEYPERLQQERRTLEELEKQHKERQLSDDEIEQAIASDVRAKLIMGFFNAMEDHMVNTYAVRRARIEHMPEPEGALLHALTLISANCLVPAGYPRSTTPDDQPGTPRHALANLGYAVIEAFKMRPEHAYYGDTNDGWAHIGVDINKLSARDTTPGNPDLTGRAALELLRNYAKRVSELQPGDAFHDRPAERMQEALTLMKQRFEVIDEAYQRFAQPLVEEIVQQEIEKFRNKRKEEQQNDGSGTDGDPASRSQKPVKIRFRRPGEILPEGMEGEAGQEPDEIIIDIPDDKPSQTPEKNDPPSADDPAAAKIGELIKKDDLRKTIEKLAAEERAAELLRQAQLPVGDRPEPPEFQPAGIGRDALEAQGDLNRYQQMACARIDISDTFAALMEAMQRAQIDLLRRRSQNLGLLPQGEPIDLRAYANLKAKRTLGISRREDRHLYPTHEDFPQPPQVSFVTLLDASPSMVPYLSVAAGMGCAINEGALIANSKLDSRGIEFHMNTWGSRPAITIAAPGDDTDAIGMRIDGLEKGVGFTRSDLAPSIEEYLEKAIDAQKSKAFSNVGLTQIVILTDGGVTDSDKALPALRALLSSVKQVSVDFLVVDHAYQDQAADTLVEALKKDPSLRERINIRHVPFTPMSKPPKPERTADDDSDEEFNPDHAAVFNAFMRTLHSYGSQPDLTVMCPKVEMEMQNIMNEAIVRGERKMAIPASEYARQLQNALTDLRMTGRIF